MEVINLNHPFQSLQIINSKVVLALGFFDGVHLGHQTVIRTAKEEAIRRDIPLALLTFNQHPKIVYGGIDPLNFKYLSTNERKIQLMEKFGVDILYLVDYTYGFGNQSPQEFVDNYIVGLNAEVAVAGYDYTYGKPNIANMTTLHEHAQERFAIISVDKITYKNVKIGTTEIKEAIKTGSIDLANNNLGYIYEIYGRVIHGKKVGRQLGFPTANVQVTHPQLIPAVGVYAVEIMVKDQWYKGAASIGYNVTFYDDMALSCEVYILDFDQYIYGEKVRIRWHHYLRGEIKFNTKEALIEQLHLDEENTRKYFEQ